MARGRSKTAAPAPPELSARVSKVGPRSLIVVLTGVLACVLTLIWGYLALIVASYGNDPVKLEICGGSLPYTFLNVVAVMGFLAGVSFSFASFSYASSGKHVKVWLAALFAASALMGLWTWAGGFTAAGCAFGV
jgi:hypothetical protein